MRSPVLAVDVEKILHRYFPDAEPGAFHVVANVIVGHITKEHHADVDAAQQRELARALAAERGLHERSIVDDRALRLLGRAIAWYADERHWRGPVPVHEDPGHADVVTPDLGRVAREAQRAASDAFPR